MKWRLIFLFFLVLTIFLTLIPSTSADGDEKQNFIYFIEGKKIISISPDVVIGSNSFLVIHSYTAITINYVCGNQTIIDNRRYLKSVVSIDVYDEGHLKITDMNNNVIVNCYIHTMNVGNFFQYIFPLKYQQLSITVVLAFISSILLVYAFFINIETKIL